jgi:hypothetical protein
MGEGTAGLVALAAWLGIRTDVEAIEEMRHPERSPMWRSVPRRIGAEIRGVRLEPDLDADVASEIRAAWLKCKHDQEAMTFPAGLPSLP